MATANETNKAAFTRALFVARYCDQNEGTVKRVRVNAA